MMRIAPLLSLALLALIGCKAPAHDATGSAPTAQGPAPIGIAQAPATLTARRIERPRARPADARPAPREQVAPAIAPPPKAAAPASAAAPTRTLPKARASAWKRVEGPSAVAPADRAAASPDATRAEVKGPRGPPIQRFDDVEIRHYDKVVFRGTIDLSSTVARILRGEAHTHRNDGAVFGNRERRLPRRPRGYYREYVHPTRGRRGPGPQRIIVGERGDWYYTPDHYQTFRPMQ
jgi:guanyl-specific ribonuclease Sa